MGRRATRRRGTGHGRRGVVVLDPEGRMEGVNGVSE
jgi:hypothetical protein